MGSGDGAGEGKGGRETMKMRMIVLNTVYSFLMFGTMMLALIGCATFQWIETTTEKMSVDAQIMLPANVPGLNKVSCGLLTYCIDAAGEVAECSLPWPRYGGDYDTAPSADEAPVVAWNVAVAFICFGVISTMIPFLYSLVACFGCFKSKLQKASAWMVMIGGWLFVCSLICFGASFGEVAVNECEDPTEDPNVGDGCSTWKLVLPSTRVEGLDSDRGCKICANNMKPFMMSSTCDFGWGGYFVLGAFIMSLLTSCVGFHIHAREPLTGNKIGRVGPA